MVFLWLEASSRPHPAQGTGELGSFLNHEGRELEDIPGVGVAKKGSGHCWPCRPRLTGCLGLEERGQVQEGSMGALALMQLSGRLEGPQAGGRAGLFAQRRVNLIQGPVPDQRVWWLTFPGRRPPPNLPCSLSNGEGPPSQGKRGEVGKGPKHWLRV